MSDLPGGFPRFEDQDVTLDGALRHIRNLEALLRASEMLEPTLSPEDRILMTLRICLDVLTADVAALVTRDHGRETAHYLLRGQDALTSLDDNRSRLAQEVLETGEEGVRREPETPGGKAVEQVLEQAPAIRVGVPLRRSDRVMGALEVAYRKDPGDRLEEDLATLRTLARHLAIVLDNARLGREYGRRAREAALLYDIGTKISAHLDLDDLLDEILDAVVQLADADAAGIFLTEHATGEIRNETLRGYDAARVGDVHLKLGSGILGHAAARGEGEIVGDVRRDDRYIEAREGTRSELVAPLKYEGRVLGVIAVESDLLNAYTPADLELVSTFANHAAISIVNADLHAQAKEKRHLEEQLEVARDIQRSLLPRRAPHIPGHELAGVNRPSSAVGGDYFDFLPLEDGRWAIVVADVSGHGVPAGLIMAGFRAEMRASLRREDDPRRIFENMNGLLYSELEPDRFVTAFLALYSPASGSLHYSSAGHEPALLLRADGGVERLSEGGMLLGVFPSVEFSSARVHLAAGDRLIVYTDGLSDAVDPWGGVLGIDGILRLYRELEAAGIGTEEIPERLLDRAEREAASAPDEADDRTAVVLVRRTPPTGGEDPQALHRE